jgi:hypothetical protein
MKILPPPTGGIVEDNLILIEVQGSFEILAANKTKTRIGEVDLEKVTS